MEWQLEVSMKKQDGTWENSRSLGVSAPKMAVRLSDLSDYVTTFEKLALTMTTPVYLKAVLRVQRSSEESFFGQSRAPTTLELEGTRESSASPTK